MLLRAAAVASREAPVPRPDQFVHVVSVRYRAKSATTREVWVSVDGSRASYSNAAPPAYFYGCRNGVLVDEQDRPSAEGGSCTPKPGYRQDLPSTLDGMRTLLRQKGVVDLVQDVYMQPNPTLVPPRTEAVLFEALAELPELKLVQPVHDAAGRPGVAVVWQPTDPSRSSLRVIFDPDTLTFRSVQVLTPGEERPTMEDTTVRWEIVDAVPNPPPGPPPPPSGAPPRPDPGPTRPSR